MPPKCRIQVVEREEYERFKRATNDGLLILLILDLLILVLLSFLRVI